MVGYAPGIGIRNIQKIITPYYYIIYFTNCMRNLAERSTIKTNRLMLINSATDVLEKIIAGDHGIFLEINIPEKWTEFGTAPFEYTLEQLQDKADDSVWWSWLPVFIQENMLIGNCGYAGPPKNGVVEIGYEVTEHYRGMGFATEIVTALIENAFNNVFIHCVIAHTLAEENASVKVLRKCGFVFSATIDDSKDGLLWKWERIKT